MTRLVSSDKVLVSMVQCTDTIRTHKCIIIIIIGLFSVVMKYNRSDTAKHDCKALV